MLEVILTMCTLVGQCRTAHIPVDEGVGVMACMMQSPVTVSLYLNEHPGWYAKRWKCGKPEQDI